MQVKKITHVEWHGIEKDGQEPVERHRGDFDVNCLQMARQFRQKVAQKNGEDFLVGLGSQEMLIEIANAMVFLCHSHQGPRDTLYPIY